MNRSLPGEIDKRKAMRGLVWLAVGNIVFAAMLVAAGELFGPGIRRISSAMTWAQPLTWAVICALIFQRRFVGLACSIAVCVAIGTIVWLGLLARDHPWALAHKSGILGHCLSLAILAIAQGLRFILGWRIALDDNSAAPRPYQFVTADLIEWTVSIGVFLGLGQLSGGFHNLALLVMHVMWQGMVSIPLAISIVSRSRTIWVLAAIGLAIAATAAYELAHAYLFSLPFSIRSSIRGSLTLAVYYIVVISANVGFIRWLGFGLICQRGARRSLGAS